MLTLPLAAGDASKGQDCNQSLAIGLGASQHKSIEAVRRDKKGNYSAVSHNVTLDCANERPGHLLKVQQFEAIKLFPLFH